MAATDYPHKVKAISFFHTLALTGFSAIALTSLPALAEDWVTSDGVKYHNVHVVRIEDDAVTILCEDGGARIPLSKLPRPLQQKFDYDPVKAKSAAEARAKEDAVNAAALQREIEQADRLKRQQEIESAQAMGLTNAAPH